MVHHHIHDTPLLYQQGGHHDESLAIDHFLYLVKYPLNDFHQVMSDSHFHRRRANTPLTVQTYNRTGRVESIDRQRTHPYTDDLVKQFVSEWRAYGKDKRIEKFRDQNIGRYVNFASDRLANRPFTYRDLYDLSINGRVWL